MEAQRFIDTERLRVAYYRTGEEHRQKLLLLHGNLSSSVFFVPLFVFLSQYFDVAAPDLRCFGDTEALPIDAKRGYRDWSDDIDGFVDALGWDRFIMAGWSLGGDIAMQYAIDHSTRLTHLVLIAPGSPFGFGGTKGEDGVFLEPVGIGTGGGCATPQLITALKYESHLMLRYVLNHHYFEPPFRMSREWEKKLMEGIAKTKLGKGMYPGEYTWTSQWPFVIAGDDGVLNTMAPQYGNVSAIAEVKEKPPILWVRGAEDNIVSDQSLFDFGYLGKIGMVPGWPGERVAPPQPMVGQTRWVLERYREKGGAYQELVIPGGHACFLESPQYFLSALCSFCYEEEADEDESEL